MYLVQKKPKMITNTFGLKIKTKYEYEYYSVFEKHRIIRFSNIFGPNYSNIFEYACVHFHHTSEWKSTLVKNTINQFDTDNLNGFDAIFRHSNLLKTIDAADGAILSNTTNISLSVTLLSQRTDLTFSGNDLIIIKSSLMGLKTYPEALTSSMICLVPFGSGNKDLMPALCLKPRSVF